MYNTMKLTDFINKKLLYDEKIPFFNGDLISHRLRLILPASAQIQTIDEQNFTKKIMTLSGRHPLKSNVSIDRVWNDGPSNKMGLIGKDFV